MTDPDSSLCFNWIYRHPLLVCLACEQSYACRINILTIYIVCIPHDEHWWHSTLMWVHWFFRRKIEDLEGERQRLEGQNSILEMRLERHNLQVSTKTSLQLFSVMDLPLCRKETNLITPKAAAQPKWHHRLIHTNLSHNWQFLKHNWTQVWFQQHQWKSCRTCGWFKVKLIGCRD